VTKIVGAVSLSSFTATPRVASSIAVAKNV
jgi:hypothetical protein